MIKYPAEKSQNTHQERKKRDSHLSPWEDHDWLEDYDSMERSVEEPPSLIPYQNRKKSLDAASASVKALAASLSSNDGREERLCEANPFEVNVPEALEYENYQPGDECSPGFWNRILGVNPEGGANNMHKKIPSNHSRLKQFQEVR